jgi:hypothetical protein
VIVEGQRKLGFGLEEVDGRKRSNRDILKLHLRYLEYYGINIRRQKREQIPVELCVRMSESGGRCDVYRFDRMFRLDLRRIDSGIFTIGKTNLSIFPVIRISGVNSMDKTTHTTTISLLSRHTSRSKGLGGHFRIRVFG